jgi:Mg/Co/Ni transporter MgtE
MKSKHFYAHLTETTDIVLELGELDLSPEERIHLLSLVEANIHSAVINTVLSNLNEENKKIFLSNLISNDHPKTWKHLNKSTEDLENKIKETIDSIKKELLKDIRKARNQKAENK